MNGPMDPITLLQTAGACLVVVAPFAAAHALVTWYFRRKGK